MKYIVIVLSIIIVVLIFLLQRKQKLSKKELLNLNKKVNEKQIQLEGITVEYNNKTRELVKLRDSYEEIKINRLKEIEELISTKEAQARTELTQLQKSNDLRLQLAQHATELALQEAEAVQQQLKDELKAKQAQYDALIQPFKEMEKQKQDRLFYTIQIPDEYKPDIKFLLTEVAPNVNHPDIISKLIWQEYVKPYIDETFKRINIESSPGIYKLTNIDSNKCYIGKSTDVKKRIQDHFKSSVGIKSIADQAIHHAILDSGLWNWTIEIICYCDKEALNENEKFYINTFKAQEWGYNKKEGG